MDNNFNGIILYEIDKDGNLKGFHTNEFLDGNINLEIAKKETCDLKIIGTYHSTFYKGELQIKNVKLDVQIKAEKSNTFKFLWTENNFPIFKGIGYVLGENQIVVYFWKEVIGNN